MLVKHLTVAGMEEAFSDLLLWLFHTGRRGWGLGVPRGHGSKRGHGFKACGMSSQPQEGGHSPFPGRDSGAAREDYHPGCLGGRWWERGAWEGRAWHPSSH